MNYPTLGEMKTRIDAECDLSGEVFVSEAEKELYINAAIDNVEAKIHSLYEDYFLVRRSIALTAGTNIYSAPTDIYATKIRSLIWRHVTQKKSHQLDRILHIPNATLYTETGTPTKFMVTNMAAQGVKINVFATPDESGSVTYNESTGLITASSGALLDCWYIRNAAVLEDDDDECDIPEFIEFVYSNIKWFIARKEKHGLDLQSAEKEFLAQDALLEKTLTDMVPDESSSLLMKDMSFYNDFDSI